MNSTTTITMINSISATKSTLGNRRLDRCASPGRTEAGSNDNGSYRALSNEALAALDELETREGRLPRSAAFQPLVQLLMHDRCVRWTRVCELD